MSATQLRKKKPTSKLFTPAMQDAQARGKNPNAVIEREDSDEDEDDFFGLVKSFFSCPLFISLIGFWFLNSILGLGLELEWKEGGGTCVTAVSLLLCDFCPLLTF